MDYQILAKLRHVRASRNTNLSLFPDFLVVGPQRTGTTWLHRALIKHPQVLHSKTKELQFFNNLHTKKNDSNLDAYLSNFIEIEQTISMKDSYCMDTYGESYKPIIKGESTANYSTLDNSVINEIKLLNPSVKIIFIVRHPAYRAWSHAKKHLLKKENVTEWDFLNFFNAPHILQKGYFTQHINRWLEIIPKKNFFLGFHEQISESPQNFYIDICKFLNVKPNLKYFPEACQNKIGATPILEIPENCKNELNLLFSDEILKLNKEYNTNYKKLS